MAGGKQAGLKAAQKNLARDPDFYRKIGSLGGKSGKNGGFALWDKQKLSEFGKVNGRKSAAKRWGKVYDDIQTQA